MEVQASTIQSASEPRLLTDNSYQNPAGSDFQKYLDEEQQRLTGLFSPLALFNFDNWFSYAIGDQTKTSGANFVKLFSDLDGNANQLQDTTSSSNPPTTNQLVPNQNQSVVNQQIVNNYFFNTTQSAIQQLLQKTGWLTPNLQAQPQFFTAQLEGKLLSKVDLQALVDKIVSQLQLVKDKGKIELSLGLKPENLGELLLILTARSGLIGIQIQASLEAKKILEAQLDELKSALKKANINLADIVITAPKEVKKDA